MLAAESGLFTRDSAAHFALAWLEQDVNARLVVDQDLCIQWMNVLAAAFLHKGIGLEMRGDILYTSDASLQERLSGFVASAHQIPSTCSLTGRNGGGHILVRAQRITMPDCHVVGLILVDAGSDFRSDYQELDVAFGLTASEHRLLLHLLGGSNADDLTRLLGISVETVRSHIRNIYGKLDVSSREQLFFQVQPFRV
jgi:DNA-binding CsgD family transcriptional regulator